MSPISNPSLSICHLYAQSMNIYGDKGNIITLVKRCQDRQINAKVTSIEINQNLNPDKFDLFFAGGGQDQSQLLISKDLQVKKTSITQAIDQNKVFLLICGSYQLFGHYFQTQANQKIPGISIFDAYTIASSNRKIGNVTGQIIDINLSIPTLVGFENHSGNTFINPNSSTKPLANILSGFGNNDRRKFEGARYKNCFGTYLHGSLLPKNPHFADYLLKLALKNKYQKDISLTPLDDKVEIQAHQFILKHRNK